MAEYIECAEVESLFSAACAECREGCEEFDGFYADCNQCLLHGVKEKLATIPAADVRPVVTCGECDNWQTDWQPSDCKEGIHFCAIIGLCKPADYFCADGKREES